VDLDFSTLPGLSVDEARLAVETWFAQVEQRHDISVRVRDFHRVNGAIRLRAQFVGPLRHPNRLLFDITLDEPILLPPERRRPIVSVFVDLQPSVLTYTLEEILAEKVRSILQRGKARDYYDVWRLLKDKNHVFNATLAYRTLLGKCQHLTLPTPTVEQLLAPEFLAEAEVYWERDLAGQVFAALPPWETVMNELPTLLEQFLGVDLEIRD
jgi:predicted nucleotidyltransferase component of viral defense system